MLDLPEPFGPVITVNPLSRLIETFLPNVLKPRISILLMNAKAAGSRVLGYKGWLWSSNKARLVSYELWLTAEPSAAPLIEPDRPQKIYSPKLRPVHIHKHQLAIRGLPEEEPAQPFLARRTNYHIRVRVWKMVRIQVLAKRLLVYLIQSNVSLIYILHNLLGSIDDFSPPS